MACSLLIEIYGGNKNYNGERGCILENGRSRPLASIACFFMVLIAPASDVGGRGRKWVG